MPRLMWTSLRALLCTTLALLSQTATAQGANNVYSRVADSVGIVIVTTFEGQLVASGSSVTVASQTMVTNRHVLLPGHRYYVLVNGGKHDAYMTNCDSVQDLCLLNVAGLEARPVEFADSSGVSVGDTVYAIGAPNEIGNMIGVAAATKQKTITPPQLTISNGLITALRPVEDGKIIQTNAAISPGSSGGGLFDNQGRLVGITTFGMVRGQSLNMALPVNWVERLGVNGSPRSKESTPPTTSATSAPQAATPAASAPQMSEAATNTPILQEQATTRTPAKANPADMLSNLPKPWWAALPVLLIAWLMLRRRNRDTMMDSLPDVYIPPPPPQATAATPANLSLQPFIEQAAHEYDNKEADQTLLAQVRAETKGNAAAMRDAYIQKRARRLLSAEKDRHWAEAARRTS